MNMALEWKDIASTVGKVAPMLGTLVGGPAGAAIGGLIASALGTTNTPDAVSQALAVNPDAAVKLAQIESDERVKLQAMVMAHADAEIAAEAASAQAVNATMQAESKSEHWPQWSWRPAIGFAVAVDLVISVIVCAVAYIGVMLGSVKPEVLNYLPAMLAAMAALVGVAMPILGIASFFRGRTKEVQAKAEI